MQFVGKSFCFSFFASEEFIIESFISSLFDFFKGCNFLLSSTLIVFSVSLLWEETNSIFEFLSLSNLGSSNFR